MSTSIKFLLTLTASMYFLTSCNNDTSTASGTDTTQTASTDSMRNDSTDKKMDGMNMDKTASGLMTSMNNMMDKMGSIKMSGDFDRDFASMMIEHHQGAIDMSQEEITSGKDEKMKAMAQSIITKQRKEQDKFRDIVKNMEPMKMDMGKHGELSENMNDMKSKMSGMEMTGNTDKDFAMMMVAHHEGAIKISKDELSHGMNTRLKEMAQKGIRDQTQEISEFKSWMSSNK